MPAYRYEDYKNPFGQSIAEMLLHRSDPANTAAVNVAALQGRAIEGSAALQGQAAQQSANAWAGAVQTSANAFGQIPQQMEQAKQTALRDKGLDLQNQEAALKVDAGRRDERSRVLFEQELRNPANYQANGTIDDVKVGAALKKQDVGAWMQWQTISAANAKNTMDLHKTALEIAGLNLTNEEKTAKVQAAQRDYLGNMAFTAIDTLRENPDDPIHARDTTLAAVARAAADGAISPKAAQDFLKQTAGASPQQLEQVFGTFVPAEMNAKLLKERADTFQSNAAGAKSLSEAMGTKAPTEAALNDEWVGLYAKQASGQPLTPDEGARLKGFEAKEGSRMTTVKTMVNGQPVERVMTVSDALKQGTFRSQPSATERAAGATAAATPGEVSPLRPDPKTGNVPDKLTGLTPNAVYQNALVFGLEGKMASQGMGANPRAKATRDAIQNQAAAIATAAGTDLPTVQAEYAANRSALVKLLPQAKATATAANTALDNLELALQQSAEVSRTGSKFVNHYAQWAQGNFTPAAGLTKFETYIYTAAREYAKVTSGGALSASGLSDTAAKEAEKLLNTAQSPQAFSAAVDAMKGDMGNLLAQQSKTLNGVSGTIASFFAAANGLPAPPPAAVAAPPPVTGAAPPAPAGWQYVPKPGGGWTAVPAK